MTQHITAQAGDIVVVVPRWLIIAVGLVMLLMGLTLSFLFLFIGQATMGVFASLFVLVMVPIQLLLLYIVWRFYWYLLILSIMVSGFLFLTVLTGFVRFGGNAMQPFARNAAGGSMFPSGDALAGVVLLSFVMALVVVGAIGFATSVFLASMTPAQATAPRRKSIRRENFPPIDDPYWDD